jgi:hypothetical protein
MSAMSAIRGLAAPWWDRRLALNHAHFHHLKMILMIFMEKTESPNVTKQ